MSKFSTCKIADIAEKIAMGPFGSNIKVATFVDSGVPIISGVHLRGFYLDERPGYNYITEIHAQNLKNSTVYPEDIIFTHAGNVGQVAMIPQNCRFPYYMISQRQFYLRCNKTKVLPQFVVYYLHSHEGQGKLLANVSQVGVPSIAQPSSFLKTIEIPLPSISEQQKLVYILDSINAKIELNAQINQNLEQQAQAIFKSWFVDFEPFKGGKFVDSELGPIPEGWSVGTLGDIIELHDSKRVPLSGSQREKMRKIYPYYGAASLMDYVEDYLFDGVYLLLGEDGTVVTEDGMPVLQYVWDKFWVNNHAHILTGKRGCSPETLYILLKNTPIKSIVTGAVQPKISQANLKSLPIVISPQELVLKYKESIAPLFAKIRENYDESKRLASLRDTLLPKLMSGEIDVSEIEV